MASMKLSDYIKTQGDAVCAARFGVKERTVAGWRRGEMYPRTAKAHEIVAATNGEVSFAEIYIEPLQRKAA